MKSILTLLTIFITINVNGQKNFKGFKQGKFKDCEIAATLGDTKIGYCSGNLKNLSCVWINERTREIGIDGDTAIAIRSLVDRVDTLYKEQIKYNNFIRSSVDFVNTVPDYLKNSPEWKQYLKQLKIQGYSVTR